MPERTLEQRYRLLAAAYLSGGASAELTQRLGAGLGQAVELITSALGRDLSAAPADLDREKVGALLGTILPARMSGAEEWRDFVPDVLDELLAFASEEESLTSAWELRTAVDENRGAFETALSDPKRPRLGGVAFAPDRRPAGKVGRNDPCPCGSGKKYKQCCLRLLG